MLILVTYLLWLLSFLHLYDDPFSFVPCRVCKCVASVTLGNSYSSPSNKNHASAPKVSIVFDTSSHPFLTPSEMAALDLLELSRSGIEHTYCGIIASVEMNDLKYCANLQPIVRCFALCCCRGFW
jgi:hypothetical protein